MDSKISSGSRNETWIGHEPVCALYFKVSVPQNALHILKGYVVNLNGIVMCLCCAGMRHQNEIVLF